MSSHIKNFLRDRLSMETRRKFVQKRVEARMRVGGRRVWPDFMILGAQRSGTSSLYRYLGAHRSVVPSLRKETEYFSTRFHLGEKWYLSHFPRQVVMTARQRMSGMPLVSFEATPDYLFHPLVPERVWKALPHIRLIVVLRDPVERAFSHYNHMRRLGIENLTFEEALMREPERVNSDLEQLELNPFHRSIDAMHYSYAARGMYGEQLDRWFEHFEPKQFLIIDFAEFTNDPSAVIERICRFVGLEPWSPNRFANYSVRKEAPVYQPIAEMQPATRSELENAFQADRERLAKLLDRSFTWFHQS